MKLEQALHASKRSNGRIIGAINWFIGLVSLVFMRRLLAAFFRVQYDLNV